MTRMRRGLPSIALVPFLVAGCLDATTPSPTPTPTRPPDPTPIVSTYELGATVWYAGFVVTFERATALLDPRGGSVTVEMLLENAGTGELGSLPGPIRLVVGEEAFEPTRESEIPGVEPGATTAATIEFDVIGHGSVVGAAIVVGRAGEHQPSIPLGPDAGEVVAFQPLALDAAGSGSAGQLRLRLRSAELRWDLPDWAQQLPESSASLTVIYDVTYTGSFAGGHPFTAENVALRLPDGTVITARPDGRSQSIELIAPGKTKRSLRTRFEIPAGTSGEVAVVVIDGDARSRVELSLPD